MSSIVTERGVRVAEHDHAQGIADEDEVDAALVEQAAHRIIVGGEGADFLTPRLAGAEVVGSDGRRHRGEGEIYQFGATCFTVAGSSSSRNN